MRPLKNPTKALSGRPWICSPCIQRRGKKSGLSVHAKATMLQRKDRPWKYGAKMEAAEWEWKKLADEIKEGKRESMLTVLEKRGFVNSIAGDRNELDQLMIERRIGAYAGIDPTGPSLHVGHLLPLMTLLWLYLHGFEAVTLLGGSTARIGDPTGRSTAREGVRRVERTVNMANMHLQLRRIWDNMERHAMRKYGYEKIWAMRRGLVNNNIWWNTKVTVLDFLRYLGSRIRISSMLSRDTVKTRMKDGNGMSFAEFSYPLMQAWDWWILFKQRNIQLQIGGADQFGNIVAGIEGVDHIAGQLIDGSVEKYKIGPLARRFGLTVPLLTTSSGEKFGKSAGNAIWLDPDMTSIFEQYQFFQRSSDADVGRYLRLFTLVPLPEIDSLLEYHKEHPQERKPQNRLAYEVMALLHGPIEADKALQSHGLLFGKKPTSEPGRPAKPLFAKDPDEINPALNRNAPQNNATTRYAHHTTIPRSIVTQESTARVLHAIGLVSSRSEGERLLQANGAYVGAKSAGNGPMSDELSFHWLKEKTQGSMAQFMLDDEVLIMRAGKWNVKIARVIDDEEFDKKGLDCPGWAQFKERRDQEQGGTASADSESVDSGSGNENKVNWQSQKAEAASGN